MADLAQLGGEVFKIPADLIERSDTSPEGLEAKNSLIEAARRVLPGTKTNMGSLRVFAR